MFGLSPGSAIAIFDECDRILVSHQLSDYQLFPRCASRTVNECKKDD
ncbi:hypothetical protein OGM63_23010 [Plectonema radiosum NIES-515]|uniref:Transposase n=1 Tax=Plectonema radiosum NIES-515 TaxID=2986073 RepID=A0ABT3B4Q3_9CYAN|nr:hypothetical protein [Plectonema radiosum]MCV3216346.1 hypothetical protein [Plectonema radiosum NIES-515]